jgi:hypothetical protein
MAEIGHRPQLARPLQSSPRHRAERFTNEDQEPSAMFIAAIDRSPALAMLLTLLATAATSIVCLGAAVGPAIS